MDGRILLFLILWPCIGGVFCFIIGRKNSKVRNNVASVVTGMEGMVYCYILWLILGKGMTLSLKLPNVCGLLLSFQMDGFRLLYSSIAIYMWFMSTIFSKQYLKHHQNRNRYYFFILFTLGMTVGVFLSNDFFTTYVFFELMSLSSYVWVVQEETKEAIKAGETYLFVAVISGMVMLMGLFLLYYEMGTTDFATLHSLLKEGVNMRLYVAGGCMLFGFGAKASMFPLHIWLPKAHPVAPAPASALLSGILTKTGIYGILLLILSMFFHNINFAMVVLLLGMITMVLGAILAIFSVDIKRILACSSMSQIGFILVGCGMIGLSDNSLAVQGTVLHMVNHSLFKLLLFLIAGTIYQNTHQLNLNELEGYGWKKPVLKLYFIIGAIGISGIPLGSGYISKTLLHESIVEEIPHFGGTEIGSLLSIIEWGFIVTGGLTLAYMLKIFFAIFVEKGKKTWKKESYLNGVGQFSLGVTAFLIFIMGILPKQVMDPITELVKPFFYQEELDHISYFSFGNIKGACLSIGIGCLLYFFVIRTCLMKKEKVGYQYKDCFPKWLDLEEILYRPLLGGMLPFLGALLCRAISQITDGLVVFLHLTLLKPAKTRQYTPVGSRFTDMLGMIADDIVWALNKTILRKNPVETSFVEIFALVRMEVRRTNRLVGRSVSFGLLMASIGLLIMLWYLLVKM